MIPRSHWNPFLPAPVGCDDELGIPQDLKISHEEEKNLNTMEEV